LNSESQIGRSLHCCVPLCTLLSRYNNEVSFHSFPMDSVVWTQWLQKIRRDNFTPAKSTRVCCRHFKLDDFYVTTRGLRKLKKGPIPLYFEWNGYELPAPRPSVCDRRPRVESPTPQSDSDAEMETEAENRSEAGIDHDYCLVPETAARTSDLADENEALLEKIGELQQQLEALQLRQRFGIERLSGSDEDVRFYTRVASYRHFLAFWRLIEPAVTHKMSCVFTSQQKLRPIDELLLFLMYLSVGFPLRDLAERFSVHRTTASRIISSWTHFLYCLLGRQRLGIPPETVKAQLLPEFKAFPDTQVELDCTEVYCQTPASLLLHSEVFSSYKSHATFKAMIGMAPHGAVTFVSGLYAGSMSDREIFKLSGIIKLLKPDMAIMVYRPAFLQSKKQMSGEDVRQTQSIARLRVHVERCIRRVKENKLFDKDIPLSVCGNTEELFSLACFLVNCQNGPLVKAWAARE
uniref:THAP-type domain-containing protein n=1 Tax=Salarias fasciatus TaxID=181472 RepID=A0A672FA09_SALFA